MRRRICKNYNKIKIGLKESDSRSVKKLHRLLDHTSCFKLRKATLCTPTWKNAKPHRDSNQVFSNLACKVVFRSLKRDTWSQNPRKNKINFSNNSGDWYLKSWVLFVPSLQWHTGDEHHWREGTKGTYGLNKMKYLIARKDDTCLYCALNAGDFRSIINKHCNSNVK